MSLVSSDSHAHFTSGCCKDSPAGVFADLLAAQLLLHELFMQSVVAVHCRGGAGCV